MQNLMQDIIYRIKAGDKETVIADFVSVLTELKVQEQCSQLILACTELPIIIEPCFGKVPGLTENDIVDSSDVMVETIIKLCKGDLDLADHAVKH